MKTPLAALALLFLSSTAFGAGSIVLPPYPLVPPHDCEDDVDPDACEAEKVMLYCYYELNISDPWACIAAIKEMICNEAGQPEHPFCGGIGALESSQHSALPVEIIELYEGLVVMPIVLDPVVFENSSANIVSVEAIGNDVWYTLDPVGAVGDGNVFYAAGAEYTANTAQLQVVFSNQ